MLIGAEKLLATRELGWEFAPGGMPGRSTAWFVVGDGLRPLFGPHSIGVWVPNQRTAVPFVVLGVSYDVSSGPCGLSEGADVAEWDPDFVAAPMLGLCGRSLYLGRFRV